MKLKQTAIQKINARIRTRLAFELGVTDQSIMRYIKENDENGPLTTYKALMIIKEETDLEIPQILEESNGVAA